MLETEGGDHLEVGVILPDGKKLMPIPKKFLRTSKSLITLRWFPALRISYLLRTERAKRAECATFGI